jgi:hypothetical protein
MDNLGIDYHASTFSIVDFIVMVAGVFEALLFVFGLIAFQIGTHSFYMSAGRAMYMARTSNLSLLNKNRQGEEELLDEYEMTEDEVDEV